MYYIIFSVIFSLNIFQIFSIEQLGGIDLEFNDLHYKTVNIEENPHYNREKSVVLINTATLKTDSFRLELAQILSKIKTFKPKAIGIDILFNNKPKIGTIELKNEINNNPKIVVANDSTNLNSTINFNAKKGRVNLPDLYTIRRYYSSKTSFGFQLAKTAYPEKTKSYTPKNEVFTINYSTINNGLSDIDSFEKTVNFSMLDANRFIHNSVPIEFYKNKIKNKIVIIGHLGTSNFDTEDKFRVPTDTTSLLLRDKTMNGAVIHANAIENILHPSSRFFELSKFGNIILEQALFILFLSILLFELGKLSNIFILILFSYLYIILIIKLMDYNVYIKVANTLLYLLFIEEFYEILEPLYIKLFKKINIENYEKK